MDNPKVVDFIPEFVEALYKQLEDDEKRWGDTWLQRTKLGQESRIYDRFDNYYDQWDEGVIDEIPWLKVAGEALIGWIRVNHPELFPK